MKPDKLLSTILSLFLILSNVVYAEDLTATQQDYDIAGTSHTMPVSVEVEPLQFSVSVPTELPCYIHADGTVDVANNAIIKNNGNNVIQVKEITVTPRTGWSIKPYNSELAQNQFGLRINEKLSTEGDFKWSNFKVDKEQEVAVTYDIKLGTYEQGLEYTPVADIVMMLDWYVHDPYEQSTGDTLYDGSTMVRMGEVLQLETPTTYSMRSIPTWTSSDESIATVDESGLVTPVQPGRVTMSYGDYEVPMHMYGEGVALNHKMLNNSNNDVVIPSHYFKDGTWYTVTSIANNGFIGCSNIIKNLVIPDTVTNLGDDAFKGCKDILSISIPESVLYIGSGAFYGCASLRSVKIPSMIEHILPSTFYNCSSITNLPLPDGLLSIGDNAFNGCLGLTDVTIPVNVTSIGSHAYYRCNNLHMMKILGKIERLPEYMFCNQSSSANFLSLYLPVTVTTIEGFVFNGFGTPANIYYEGTEGQWNAITVHSNNGKLLGITKHYNSTYRST